MVQSSLCLRESPRLPRTATLKQRAGGVGSSVRWPKASLWVEREGSFLCLGLGVAGVQGCEVTQAPAHFLLANNLGRSAFLCFLLSVRTILPHRVVIMCYGTGFLHGDRTPPNPQGQPLPLPAMLSLPPAASTSCSSQGNSQVKQDPTHRHT